MMTQRRSAAVYSCVRRFLAKRHKVGGRGKRCFSMKVIIGELGANRVTSIQPRAATVSLL